MNKKFKVVFLTCIMILQSAILQANNSLAQDNEALKLMGLFGDVYDKIKKEYVEEPDDKELIEASLNGMLSSLDPHSTYFTEKEYEELNMQTKGEFGGLGIEFIMENGLVKVIAPIDDKPAQKAGMKSGDYIVAINDEPVMGMTSTEAMRKMRGKPGTKIKLTVVREDSKEPLEFKLIRESIHNKSVKSQEIDNNIGYVRISSFIEQTPASVREEINNLKSKMGKNFKGLVLDLRNNPGGLFPQAIDVADLFLDHGEIVSTRGRKKESIVRYNATKGDMLSAANMVVLVNGGSASGAEIVAGALQDHKRAILMGTKSFGKGSVQTVMPMSGYGAIKFTTARYFTPSGKSIQAEGIMPDIVVEPAKLEYAEQKDFRKIFAEANLKGHLEKEKKEDKKNNQTEEKKPDDNKGEAVANVKAKLDNKWYEGDYQLIRAVDLLKTLSILDKEKAH